MSEEKKGLNDVQLMEVVMLRLEYSQVNVERSSVDKVLMSKVISNELHLRENWHVF